MTRRYVNQFGHQEAIDQVFLASDKQLRPNRNGNLYLQFEPFRPHRLDRRRMWNASEAVYKAFENGDYVRVEGTTQLFQGAIQLIATRLSKIDPSEVNGDDFQPLRAVDVDKLVLRLGEILRSLTDPALRTLGECFLMDEAFMAKFVKAPAGMKNHHAYQGGLLEHVVNLMEVVLRISPCYPQIDRDLLLFGAFLHDLGKIDELRYDRDLSYSDEGQLIGHLVMAVGMLEKKIAEAQKLSGEPVPEETVLAAEAHDRQPPRRVRLRQSEVADDRGGRGPVLPRQSRRQGQLLPAASSRRRERRQRLDRLPSEPRPEVVQGEAQRGQRGRRVRTGLLESR